MKYILVPFCHREEESLMKTSSIRQSIYNLNVKTKKIIAPYPGLQSIKKILQLLNKQKGKRKDVLSANARIIGFTAG